jgi:hypothetical protein
MATNNVEGMSFKVVDTGNPLVDNRIPSNLRPMNLDRLDAFIDGKVKDKRTAEAVKKLARSYPQQALNSFKKNIQTHIARAQKKLKDTPLHTTELGEDTPKPKTVDIDSIRDLNDEFN